MGGKYPLFMAIGFLLIIGVCLITLMSPMSITKFFDLDHLQGLSTVSTEGPVSNQLLLPYSPEFDPKGDIFLSTWKGYGIEMVKEYPNYFAGLVIALIIACLGFVFSVRKMVKEKAHEEADHQ